MSVPTRLLLAAAALISTGVVAACVSVVPPAATVVAPVPMPRVDAVKAADAPGLRNVVSFHEGVLSGSVPEGDAGFDTLSGWSVRTILSVDGAAPDVASAGARGIRYVHLPIGYDGFDQGRRAELARVVRDLPKPMYIHCHHGKHRSAGAAASALASLGWIAPERGVERMKVSGTSEAYTGLYQCAAAATVLTPAEVDAAPADFPETTRPDGQVAAMLVIDDAMDRLKVIARAGWQVPPDHPDLVPVAEAGRLAEGLRVWGEHAALGGEFGVQGVEFAAQTAAAVRAATALEQALAGGAVGGAGRREGGGAVDQARAAAAMKLVAASCKDCHAVLRDRPGR